MHGDVRNVFHDLLQKKSSLYVKIFNMYLYTLSPETTSSTSSSPSLLSTTVALVNASFGFFSLARITHWVVRPVMRISARGTLTVCPSFEISITDHSFFCSGVSVNAPMTCPVFSVVAPTFTPDQPLHCSR